MSTLDSAWVMTAGYDGLAAHNSPAWMALYLAVCKLLDLALVLPAHVLPQFQMYRWAFVSEGGSEAVATTIAAAAAASVHNGDLSADIASVQQHMHLPQQDFVPYVVRVAKLLLHKVMKYVCVQIIHLFRSKFSFQIIQFFQNFQRYKFSTVISYSLVKHDFFS